MVVGLFWLGRLWRLCCRGCCGPFRIGWLWPLVGLLRLVVLVRRRCVLFRFGRVLLVVGRSFGRSIGLFVSCLLVCILVGRYRMVCLVRVDSDRFSCRFPVLCFFIRTLRRILRIRDSLVNSRLGLGVVVRRFVMLRRRFSLFCVWLGRLGTLGLGLILG